MKYEEIMDRIEVTPEMRQRVLHKLEAAQTRKKRQGMLRPIFTMAACLAIVLCCWIAWRPQQTPDPEQGMLAASQIETVDSLQALSQKTGLPLAELTDLPFAVERTEYVSYWDSLAEIQYFGEGNTLRYRKSRGTEDNSGDYNVYAQEMTLEVSGSTVTLKGENSAYTLALWTDGQYAYSISVDTPLSRDAFQMLLEKNFRK